jgi:UTP--glucose-1-phosphate uridylyltransferase
MIDRLNPEIFKEIKFHYIFQEEQNGLGHAVLHAEKVVGKDPFAVLLPDDLFFSEKSCLSQLLDIYKKTESSVIAVNKIEKENIHKYGVIKPGKIKESLIKIEDIVEKPSYEEAPSDIAVCGRYIFNASIFKFLKSTNFDKSGEIQLTDAIKKLLQEEEVYASIYDGEKFDCGSKQGFVHATIALALRDESIKPRYKKNNKGNYLNFFLKIFKLLPPELAHSLSLNSLNILYKFKILGLFFNKIEHDRKSYIPWNGI